MEQLSNVSPEIQKSLHDLIAATRKKEKQDQPLDKSVAEQKNDPNSFFSSTEIISLEHQLLNFLKASSTLDKERENTKVNLVTRLLKSHIKNILPTDPEANAVAVELINADKQTCYEIVKYLLTENSTKAKPLEFLKDFTKNDINKLTVALNIYKQAKIIIENFAKVEAYFRQNNIALGK